MYRISTTIQPMDKIIDRIYVGNYSSATMLDYDNPEGITYILNCTPDAHRGLKKFQIRQLNINDGVEMSPEVIRFALEMISEAIHNGGKILVHCHAGISRSVSLVCAHLMYAGFSWDEAVEFVSSRRPQAFPNPHIARSIKHYFGNYINSRTTLLGK